MKQYDAKRKASVKWPRYAYADGIKRAVGCCQNADCPRDGLAGGDCTRGFEVCFDFDHRVEADKERAVSDICNETRMAAGGLRGARGAAARPGRRPRPRQGRRGRGGRGRARLLIQGSFKKSRPATVAAKGRAGQRARENPRSGARCASAGGAAAQSSVARNSSAALTSPGVTGP